jgi:hypothetical protein
MTIPTQRPLAELLMELEAAVRAGDRARATALEQAEAADRLGTPTIGALRSLPGRTNVSGASLRAQHSRERRGRGISMHVLG